MDPHVGSGDTALLEALSRIHPNAAHALAEVAALRASLTLPARTIHIISDVHGEHAKLRHVINNASGALRPAVASLLNASLTDTEQRELLALIYYPSELITARRDEIIDAGRRREWVRRMLDLQFELIRGLARSWRREQLNALLPFEFRELFKELLWEPMHLRPPAFLDLMLGAYEHHDRDFGAVRAASRLVRNLTAHEIIVAGDLGDRGPRIDKVIDFLMSQPDVKIIWGNHDAHWLGACLGHEACIASVLRFSLRYRRLSQLEEGYGIVLTELEKLATDVYGDDPATHFTVKGKGTVDDLLLARMQKAIAVIQLKLEGQLIGRHPEWGLADRDVLHAIDLKAGTVRLGDAVVPLTDARLPTLDPANPNALSEAEQRCMNALRASFTASPRLWEHMNFVVGRGSMWTTRDDLLIFHACVPVDKEGTPLPLTVQGRAYAGRELFDVLTTVVRKAFRLARGASAASPSTDLQTAGDWLWYLWCGPRSPLFGKDKIATFETYFVEDEKLKSEKKNPYFELIHDAAFVRRIGRLFGCGEDVLLVNGHVPVKLEKGEQPVKKGGNAVTIDGAFAEAYGDHGYTLLLSPTGITLAEHTHFDSVDAVVKEGKDIVPKVTPLRRFDPPKKISDTHTGTETKAQLQNLEKLITAYEEGTLLES
jgi:fructose-1,6-bisphosphatase-3